MENTTPQNDVNEDWEEWDGRSPFWAHCVAGSLAGVVEHAAIYPLDTVRTHIQVCAACICQNGSSSPLKPAASTLMGKPIANQSQHLPLGVWQTIRYLISEPALAAVKVEGSTQVAVAPSQSTIVRGFSRLFRGVQTIVIGSIPAHALYFSSYEIVKAAFINKNGEVSTVGSSLAGAAAVASHDLVMTPLDTLKQRLQLGHYAGVTDAFREVTRNEGAVALYRSFPITLASNIPYGMIMVSTNESCKQFFAVNQPDRPKWQVILASSSFAGFVASAVTTPLDRIKTALQTQRLEPLCRRGLPQDSCRLLNQQKQEVCRRVAQQEPKHTTWKHAAVTIWKKEGWTGFVRGMTPRILSHTPAVAVSWSTYETAKAYLLSSSQH